jgi:hypothetical protein
MTTVLDESDEPGLILAKNITDEIANETIFSLFASARKRKLKERATQMNVTHLAARSATGSGLASGTAVAWTDESIRHERIGSQTTYDDD